MRAWSGTASGQGRTMTDSAHAAKRSNAQDPQAPTPLVQCLVMKSLSGKHAAFFMVVAETITPEVAALDRGWPRPDGGHRRHRADGSRCGHAIADSAPSSVVIRMAPTLRYGRPFDRLDADRRSAVLAMVRELPDLAAAERVLGSEGAGLHGLLRPGGELERDRLRP